MSLPTKPVAELCQPSVLGMRRRRYEVESTWVPDSQWSESYCFATGFLALDPGSLTWNRSLVFRALTSARPMERPKVSSKPAIQGSAHTARFRSKTSCFYLSSRLLDVMYQPFSLDEGPLLQVGVSIGIAEGDDLEISVNISAFKPLRKASKPPTRSTTSEANPLTASKASCWHCHLT